MQPRPRLAEVLLVLVVAIVGVGGFLAPTPTRLHDHAHSTGSRRCFVPVGPSSRRAIEGLPSQSWNARVPLLRMNGKEGDSQEPSREGIDTEGIDARGGDTAGIYGFAREVVEKEEAQAPFRRLRLIGYAVPAFIAIFLAGISLAGMAGLDEFKEVSENLPNPLIDAGVVGVAFYLWVEEVKTKRSSLALLKKQYEEQSKVPNRSSRRQKKMFGKKKTKASATVAAATATSGQPPAPAAAQTEAEAPAAPKKGMFEGVKETLDAVNKQSYYQALALNKELEEKGVLPPLERKLTPPGGDNGGEAVVAEDGPELAATAATVATGVPDGGREAAPAAATSKVGGSKRRKKGKGGNKGKRK